jgi:SAM-dependent methyltransferase
MTRTHPSDQPETWHHGVVAKWWAEFNTSGRDIRYFQRYVEAGQPALDVACGTGRLLIPYLRAGFDVDGCDVSADMLDLCRERAHRHGLTPRLHRQAMHELDFPRKYRTIYVCGGFGLGGSRDHDELALQRFREHLEPGGTLILDNEVPYSKDASSWRHWTREGRDELPTAWSDPSERRLASDGTEYALSGRTIDLDPYLQRVTAEIRGYRWRSGDLIEQDEHGLKMTLYFTNELRLLLERAGFSGIELRADYTDDEPTGDTTVVVFIARKT